jgi:hypothetical protein
MAGICNKYVQARYVIPQVLEQVRNLVSIRNILCNAHGLLVGHCYGPQLLKRIIDAGAASSYENYISSTSEQPSSNSLTYSPASPCYDGPLTFQCSTRNKVGGSQQPLPSASRRKFQVLNKFYKIPIRISYRKSLTMQAARQSDVNWPVDRNSVIFAQYPRRRIDVVD